MIFFLHDRFEFISKKKRKKSRNPRNAAELNLNLRQRENIDAAKKRNPSRKY